MTETNASLADLLRPVKHVLLDFDGPVCSVFAGFPASDVAKSLQEELEALGWKAPAENPVETDPLALLRQVAERRPDLVSPADRQLTLLETAAVQTGRPNLGGEAVLRACAESGRAVSIVSNNATAAIESYLTAHDLTRYVTRTIGRTPGDPSSMKPSPRLLLAAMGGGEAWDFIFVGDAARDVEAGLAAGIGTIGYANKPGKRERLEAAGALVVVDSMKSIAIVLSDRA
ncbi:HAD family hydrolase [Kitasatospora cineracea]|uniref:Phosphoglycolate phosphatase-like HAD superfamily hydrolase n=1 Tax=Kitasatospora cineracea TaxID=88074 RepID=A0A3N4RS66_9ACTN|nr:HAD hydrolase-like protein [Kitasatospora cineracea]RPE33751.1 phosphoglycolate phosphatase-like HAD superfamily hydrolase [Kitasatospora cineracea]